MRISWGLMIYHQMINNGPGFLHPPQVPGTGLIDLDFANSNSSFFRLKWAITGGVTPYDGKTGFIWANPRFKVIRAFERLIILIILIN